MVNKITAGDHSYTALSRGFADVEVQGSGFILLTYCCKEKCGLLLKCLLHCNAPIYLQASCDNDICF